MSKTKTWKLEDEVNDWVKKQLKKLDVNFNVESNTSDYLKDALRGSAKTKTNFGKPDFHIEHLQNIQKQPIPVLFENKLGASKLIAETKEGVKFDDKSISGFAVNGALHYAKSVIASGKYHEAIAVGIAGSNAENVMLKVYYVYGYAENSYKEMSGYKTLDFLEDQKTFTDFYQEAVLTEDEKHKILIDSKETLSKYSKELNKLMHDLAITAPQRVLYVSGMLLSMQDLESENLQGLTPEKLLGAGINTNQRDGLLIKNQIENFLNNKGIPEDKKQLMLASFNEISKDNQRDEPQELNKLVGKLLNGKASFNKQIFSYIYYNIFSQIDAMAGHLDIMGEMYSEFLKYALGDGKEIGIVLTPPYVTKMMAEILDVNLNDKVMDLATGSAGFLISAMEIMIRQAENEYAKGSTKANDKIETIKKNAAFGCRA